MIKFWYQYIENSIHMHICLYDSYICMLNRHFRAIMTVIMITATHRKKHQEFPYKIHGYRYDIPGKILLGK